MRREEILLFVSTLQWGFDGPQSVCVELAAK